AHDDELINVVQLVFGEILRFAQNDKHYYTFTVALARVRAGRSSSSINRAKAFRSSDCGPSESARSGQGCTSIMMPSAPAAIAARLIAGITLRRPVPCEGSAITGRCDSSLAKGIAARPNVLRSSDSN